MRALLVVNPQATSTTAAGRDVLAHALASAVKLDVLQTQYRGHAAEATASAVRAGVELVIAHGGDGTINEVVNGILEAAPPASTPEPPLLAVLPGGSANVFARALGLPRDPWRPRRRYCTRWTSGGTGPWASAGRTTAGSPSTRASARTPT